MNSSTITLLSAKIHHFKRDINTRKGCYEVVVSTYSPQARGANNFIMPEMTTYITINISSNYFHRYLDKVNLRKGDEIYLHGEFRQNNYQQKTSDGSYNQNEVYIYMETHIFRLKSQPIELDDDDITGSGRNLAGLTINEVYLQGKINSAISIKSFDHGNNKIKINQLNFILKTFDKVYNVWEGNNHLIFTRNKYLTEIIVKKLKLNKGDTVHLKGRLITKYNEHKQRTHSIEILSVYDFEVINKKNLDIEIVNEGESIINQNFYSK